MRDDWMFNDTSRLEFTLQSPYRSLETQTHLFKGNSSFVHVCLYDSLRAVRSRNAGSWPEDSQRRTTPVRTKQQR